MLVDTEDGDSIIHEVLPRRNYIIRQSARNRTAEHIIAANLDQAIIMATIAMPRTSTGFIDRFLVTATAYHVPAVVVFNKIDLYAKDELQYLDELVKMYTDAGFQVVITSAEKNINVDVMYELIKGKFPCLQDIQVWASLP